MPPGFSTAFTAMNTAALAAGPPGWILPAASALIGGIANIFSGQSAEEAQQKRIRAANSLLERNITDDNELARILRGQTRAFNAGLQNTINSTAIRSGGYANKEVVGAAVAGNIEAQKYATLSQTEMDVKDRNAEIRARQAANVMSGDIVADPIGDFVSGGVAGGIAGAQFNRTLALTDELKNDPLTQDSNQLLPWMDSAFRSRIYGKEGG